MALVYPEIKDIDELCGFSAARERAAEGTATDANVYEELTYIPYRIFLNHVDTFNGRHLSSFIADQSFGAKNKSAGEEGEEEVENEQVQPEAEESEVPKSVPAVKCEIIGTLDKPFHKKTEDILFTIKENTHYFMEEVFKCGFVIYDISKNPNEIPKALATLAAMDEKIESLKELGPKTFKGIQEVRAFILISTAMTWALTKPIDPEDPTLPFTEADYKKRKPHPNYKIHTDCEKEVIMTGRKNKDKLKTYVIASGIIYGAEEADLTFLFKLTWNNEKEMPVFQSGKNSVPLIHVKDLAKVVYGLMVASPSKPQYILAVEQTPSKLKQVIKALSKTMGTGKTKNVTGEEALLYPELNQTLYERYTVNLSMEPEFIVETLELEWQNDLNLAENMAGMVNEFKKYLQLKPIKIILHGPPAVGKTNIAKQLSEIYGAHYMSVKMLIANEIERLENTISLTKAKQLAKEEKEKAAQESDAVAEEEPEEEEEEEEEVEVEELEEQLKSIQNTMLESDNGKLPDEQVIELMKTFMQSNKCQNQGYILDGFPKTMEQTKALFGGGGEGEEEEVGEEEEGGGGGGSNLPDFVISLQAADQYLYERIMLLPERLIQGTHYTEENMIRRMSDFRSNNTEDNTLLNYFDEMEIHPIVLDAMEDITLTMDGIIKELIRRLGKPIKFPLTADEEEELMYLENEKNKLLEKEGAMKRQLLEEEAVEHYHKNMEEWTGLLEQFQLEEEKILVAQGEPLRHYMIKFIFPTLSKGLLEVARMKPDDPVDFLAEYLFKENPEGHMFDPAYTREGKLILDNFKNNVKDDIVNSLSIEDRNNN